MNRINKAVGMTCDISHLHPIRLGDRVMLTYTYVPTHLTTEVLQAKLNSAGIKFLNANVSSDHVNVNRGSVLVTLDEYNKVD